jgi:hypothetical protein
LWLAIGAVATFGGAVTFVHWGYTTFVEGPRREAEQATIQRDLADMKRLVERLVAQSQTPGPGQAQAIGEAVDAAAQDPRLEGALALLQAGKTGEAAA